jgi:hypothetical protein
VQTITCGIKSKLLDAEQRKVSNYGRIIIRAKSPETEIIYAVSDGQII